MNGFLNYRSWHIDKVAHILSCLAITYIVHDFLTLLTALNYWLALLIAVVAAAITAVAKELLDKKSYGLFDLFDLIADAKGVALAAVIITLKHLLSASA